MLTAPRTSEDLDKVIEACSDDLVIDYVGLDFIDSSGFDGIDAATSG